MEWLNTVVGTKSIKNSIVYRNDSRSCRQVVIFKTNSLQISDFIRWPCLAKSAARISVSLKPHSAVITQILCSLDLETSWISLNLATSHWPLVENLWLTICPSSKFEFFPVVTWLQYNCFSSNLLLSFILSSFLSFFLFSSLFWKLIIRSASGYFSLLSILGGLFY